MFIPVTGPSWTHSRVGMTDFTDKYTRIVFWRSGFLRWVVLNIKLSVWFSLTYFCLHTFIRLSGVRLFRSHSDRLKEAGNPPKWHSKSLTSQGWSWKFCAHPVGYSQETYQFTEDLLYFSVGTCSFFNVYKAYLFCFGSLPLNIFKH